MIIVKTKLVNFSTGEVMGINFMDSGKSIPVPMGKLPEFLSLNEIPKINRGADGYWRFGGSIPIGKFHENIFDGKEYSKYLQGGTVDDKNEESVKVSS